jgi:hypothetical protein
MSKVDLAHVKKVIINWLWWYTDNKRLGLRSGIVTRESLERLYKHALSVGVDPFLAD